MIKYTSYELFNIDNDKRQRFNFNTKRWKNKLTHVKKNRAVINRYNKNNR
jgi:hypothetical protein